MRRNRIAETPVGTLLPICTCFHGLCQVLEDVPCQLTFPLTPRAQLLTAWQLQAWTLAKAAEGNPRQRLPPRSTYSQVTPHTYTQSRHVTRWSIKLESPPCS